MSPFSMRRSAIASLGRSENGLAPPLIAIGSSAHGQIVTTLAVLVDPAEHGPFVDAERVADFVDIATATPIPAQPGAVSGEVASQPAADPFFFEPSPFA